MARSGNRGSSGNNRGGSSGGFTGRAGTTMRRSPYASAAALGALAGVASLFWMKRSSGKSWSEFGEDLTNRASERWSEATERLGDMRHRDGVDPDRSQTEIMEEAMTLKETGAHSKGARGPIAQQDIKAGIATSNQEAKAGAKGLS